MRTVRSEEWTQDWRLVTVNWGKGERVTVWGWNRLIGVICTRLTFWALLPPLAVAFVSHCELETNSDCECFQVPSPVHFRHSSLLLSNYMPTLFVNLPEPMRFSTLSFISHHSSSIPLHSILTAPQHNQCFNKCFLSFYLYTCRRVDLLTSFTPLSLSLCPSSGFAPFFETVHWKVEKNKKRHAIILDKILFLVRSRGVEEWKFTGLFNESWEKGENTERKRIWGWKLALMMMMVVVNG